MTYNFSLISRINKIMEGKYEVTGKSRLLVVESNEDKVTVPRNGFYEGLIFKGVAPVKKTYRPDGLKAATKSNLNKLLSFRYPQ